MYINEKVIVLRYSHLVNVANGGVRALRKISEDFSFSSCTPGPAVW